MPTLTPMKTQLELFKEEAERFQKQHPDLEKIEVLYSGFCGPLRGKWLPASMLSKLTEGAVRLPLSTVALDVWGVDVSATGLAIERGDPDGILMPVPGTLKPVPWAKVPTAQVLVTLFELEEQTPHLLDPRYVLETAQAKLKDKGLTPVVATELEFYFIDMEPGSNGLPLPPIIPGTKHRLKASQIYDLDIMAQFEPILAEINRACKIQGIPADTTIAEFGHGQFEINLLHVPDALEAADHCLLFKRVIRHIARKHGMDVTFMAKPYAECTGSGFHVHTSLLDANGANVFTGETDEASPTLRHAVGGLLETMLDMQILFAPHANSYRRLQPASYAPTACCWGYDHRAAAVRVPATKGVGARLEHRVAGADANPYLVVAALLHGINHGLEHKCDPGTAITPQEDLAKYKHLSGNWETAITRWKDSAAAQQMTSSDFHRIYSISRSAEYDIFATTVTAFECQTYAKKV
ncbi:glutamine synthetase family protein [Pseudovibrio sp. Tun.PSC04-5.I4]|uniref:glutamine synthetase family protein n=1 Tax=Pseudovibrio sp. Tun.PSC04-5.I4 TaxID=1798213 RepID=UPI0008920F3F|nr:glutamine synthetase family protein [Pseudovibrio sp. Tun.PSC04-5.I4]SDR14159.1 glutamate--putrescine ligase [Pseudovibrio sp. Tun.PSC04-5.I4]